MSTAEGQGGRALVRLVGVHKAFGALTVLGGVDLEVREGQTMVVIGPSGTGKSVLLKHIVGLLRPDRGEVWFRDQRVDRLSDAKLVEVRRRIGVVFQMGALFDSQTVGENIGFPLVESGERDQQKVRARCAELLELVGLSGIESKMPADLSGGQRKRVALARAIALSPDLVLYDEPTTGLDPPRADLINELILTLRRDLGMTGVAVTHDMDSANKIADRMVMLYHGRVIADAPPEAFRGLDDRVVQDFIQGRADRDELEAIRHSVAAGRGEAQGRRP